MRYLYAKSVQMAIPEYQCNSSVNGKNEDGSRGLTAGSSSIEKLLNPPIN